MTDTDRLETVVALFINLVELAEATERLHGIPDWMSELHQQHKEHKAQIDALEEAMEASARERRDAEGEISEEQEKLKRYQLQLNTVKNQREYGALLHEIDTAKGKIAALEEQGFAAMEQRDQARQELEKERQAFEEVDRRYAAELKKWETEKPSVADRVKLLEKESQELRGRLPRPDLSLFERIFDRHSTTALAVVHKVARVGRGQQIWHCGGCNYRVRPQSVVQVQSGSSLVQCDACKRILYFTEPAEAQA